MLAVGAQETIMTIGAPAPHGVPGRGLDLFEVSSGNLKVFKALSTWFSSIGFSADSSRVAAITFDRDEGAPMNGYKNTVVNVWDINTGDAVLQTALPDDTSLYSYLSFLGASGTIIATSGASWGGDVAIIDTSNGKIAHAGGRSTYPLSFPLPSPPPGRSWRPAC